ncbi:hypothetical protein Patl1_04307 [Pistacia atlantica]|uniref:Uncharacterized protein n=1 Tax=Pistacia atlantica TaxID=434234 RepID=A0ACC1BQW0_9ROSI|nr:hypothetical protein Patl1_04307 [Pistacia atlantica]
MAKLVLLLSAFAFLILAANASIYRATVEVEGENLSSGQSCQKQFEEQQKFKHCQMYVQQEVQKSQDGHSLTARINQRQQCFKQCCQEVAGSRQKVPVPEPRANGEAPAATGAVQRGVSSVHHTGLIRSSSSSPAYGDVHA